MKVYEAVFDEEKTEGVYALSVVERPAMEDFWIALNEHPKEINLTLANEEKRLLLGAALIPNKKVYRNIDGYEFFLTMSEETIEQLAHSFIKKGYQNNSSLEHEAKLSGMSVVETWIVKDKDKDKSNAYGKQYEQGTWVAMMKVEDDAVWEKVKKGEVKGFSIDAVLGLQEIKFKNEVNMSDNTKSIADAIKDGFKSVLATFSNENKEAVIEEPKEEVETVAETTQEVENEFDYEAFKKDLEAVLAELSKQVDSKIDSVKAEFSETLKTKETEIETLKTELSKKPEAETVKDAPVEADVQLSATGSILELMRKYKN